MLEVQFECHEYLIAALLHALTLGMEEQFVGQLKYLDGYGSPEGQNRHSLCLLYKDFAPHSFGFALYWAKLMEETDEETGYRRLQLDAEGKPQYDRDCQPVLGGLIFHPGVGTPGIDDGSLSVELNPQKGPHWSVHT